MKYFRKHTVSLTKIFYVTVILTGLCFFHQNLIFAKEDNNDKKNPMKRLAGQNRLALEKSPYLLQHADNPVDWYPWSKEAFDRAKKEDKPVFLSIGYSTCHWCHVMAHESFENENIARVLNDNFISIKVDREERPDIDTIYMSAVQAMTGRGGWPLSIFLTPDKKPFFGGTYYPPYSKWGSPGFMDILASIDNSWQNDRQQLLNSGNVITNRLAKNLPGQNKGQTLDDSVLKTAFVQFQKNYDEKYGGFGYAPKFPTSHNLSFLLRYWKRSKNQEALKIVEFTLKEMARGGMYDHLGGGFHRYSTDREWQIPHFEKMLYDQAILARTYLEVFQITHDPSYENTAREILNYCLRDLRDQTGAFHSAEDADSLDPYKFGTMTLDPDQKHQKKEGSFYLWKYDHLWEVLGKNHIEIFSYHFGIEKNGNAKSDPHDEFTGKNVIFIQHTLKETAKHFKISESDVKKSIAQSKEKLLKIRNSWPRPHLDDKVLVDWNGLIISSLAYGARVLNDPKYLEAAEEAAQFIIYNMIKKDRLLHRYRSGESGIQGTIEDYAFFINGLVDLYEATFNTLYLQSAVSLTKTMLNDFWDKEHGGFHFTANNAEELIIRPKEIYDGAIPSGNSMAALVLVRLYHITFDNIYEERLQGLFMAFSKEINRRASGYGQFLIALDFAMGPAQEIVMAGSLNDVGIKQINDEINKRFLPNKVVVHRDSDEKKAKDIFELSPFTKKQPAIDGKVTTYICENHVCQKPTNDINKVIELLDDLQ